MTRRIMITGHQLFRGRGIVLRSLSFLTILVTGPLSAQLNYEANYQFTTVAGAHVLDGTGAIDGSGPAARFSSPASLAIDGAGNLYAADRFNHTIRKIAPDGTVTTIAGSPGLSGGVDGSGSVARFNFPCGVAADGLGNVYVADALNHAIRKISPGGVVSTLAGSLGKPGYADGDGASARFANPRGVAVDALGNLYVADSYNCTIRKVTPAGRVSTVAGYPGLPDYADGSGTEARFSHPAGVAVDGVGNVYVSDDYTVRRISPAGTVSLLAGRARSPRLIGSYFVPDSFHDGTGADASFEFPVGLTVDGSGNVYVADSANHSIRKVTPAGTVSLFAGGPPVFFFYQGPVNGTSYSTYEPQPGDADGVGTDARFRNPNGLVLDSSGNLWVADSDNFTIRKITASGLVSTFAGTSGQSGVVPRDAAGGSFDRPQGFAVAENGTVIVADSGHHTIRSISPSGVVTTVAGLTGQGGSTDGNGLAARFLYPTGVVVGSGGIIYVADRSNHTIRKITSTGEVTTLAGQAGQAGSANGIGGTARFRYPQALAIDATGTLYVADSGNGTVRRISPDGTVSTLATYLFSGESGTFDEGIGLDRARNVFVSANGKIRKITPAGDVSVFAGGAAGSGSLDGEGTSARFIGLKGLGVDGADNVYVADVRSGSNSLIRKISPAGSVSTVASINGPALSVMDRLFVGYQFPNAGLAVDGSGNLYFANDLYEIIRGQKLPTPEIAITGQSQQLLVRENYPFRMTVEATGPLPLTYQWQELVIKHPDSDPKIVLDYSSIPGANSSMYQVDYEDYHSKSTSSGGSFYRYFRVLISDGTGTISSKFVTLEVKARRLASGYAADFNGDGQADLLWQNSETRERSIWFMTGTNFLSSSSLGFFEPGWSIAATGDFNGDGKTDIVWSSDITGERALWLMNGPFLLGISTFGIFPLEWTVAATGDFDGDGQPDLVWSNSVTGERALWLMNGTNFKAASTLGFFPLEWTVAATGDFNADDKPDIVWSNSVTGERAIWLMNGTNFLAASTLGVFPLEWTVRGTADFNADGKPDIIWSNRITGERALWLMNGTNFLGASTLGIFPLEWTVSN